MREVGICRFVELRGGVVGCMWIAMMWGQGFGVESVDKRGHVELEDGGRS